MHILLPVLEVAIWWMHAGLSEVPEVSLPYSACPLGKGMHKKVLPYARLLLLVWKGFFPSKSF